MNPYRPARLQSAASPLTTLLTALPTMALAMIPCLSPLARAEIVTILAHCEFSPTSTLAGKGTTLDVQYTYLSLVGIPTNDPRQSRYDLILSDTVGPYSRITVQRSLSGQTYSAERVALSMDTSRVDGHGHVLAVYVDTRSNGDVIADPAMPCALSTFQVGTKD